MAEWGFERGIPNSPNLKRSYLDEEWKGNATERIDAAVEVSLLSCFLTPLTHSSSSSGSVR
jgi:hypothetical protein